MAYALKPYHFQYLESIFSWQMCRDTLAGEPTVKMRKTRYLPMPASMAVNPEFSPINLSDTDYGFSQFNGEANNLFNELKVFDPNYHRNSAYQAYITRAQFPEIPSFILRGLLGLTSNEKPTIKLPKSMEYLLTCATSNGQSLHDHYMTTISEILSTGRYASVVDVDNDKLIFATYKAEDIVSWKHTKLDNSSKKVPSMVILSEITDSTPDSLEITPEKVFKVLVYDKKTDNYYVKQAKQQDIDSDLPFNEIGELVEEPSYRGKNFKKIPIQMFGPLYNTFQVQNPPMMSIASTAVQIYMKYADLSNSEFMSCSPTLIMTGVDDAYAPKAIGSTIALIIPQPDAKVYYTKTDTSALSHVLRHITDLYEQAIHSGAQLLDSSKKAAESAETTRLKQAAASATLSSVVRNAANGIENQLKEIAELIGEDPNEIVFSSITDFSAPALTANEQQALVKSWVDGAMSHSTLLENFRRGGLLHDGESADEEIKRILTDKIKPQSKQPPQQTPQEQPQQQPKEPKG